MMQICLKNCEFTAISELIFGGFQLFETNVRCVAETETEAVLDIAGDEAHVWSSYTEITGYGNNANLPEKNT